MDPTNEELQGFANLDDVVQWIGMAPPLLAGLRTAAGDFRLLREIVLVPGHAWDAAVTATRVALPPAEEGGPAPDPADRAPNALELGQIASLRRVARLRLGLPPEEPRAGAGRGAGAPGAAAEAQAAGGAEGGGAAGHAPGGAPAALQQRKVRLSQVFDQADDTEIVPWTPARTRAVLAAFKAANDGEDPEPEEEVSPDQLAALEHRLAQGLAPCPDFGVWRPFGQRLARALKLVVHHVTPGGDYVPYEVAGPPSYNEWKAAFQVFSVGMRALQAATATRLNMYANRIARFNEVYGHVCWWLVAQADQRMRSEHMERIRRQAEEERNAATAAGQPHPMDPRMPWDYCFKIAAQDRRFWDEELDRKCVLYITHLKTQKQLSDAGFGDIDAAGRRSAGGGGATASSGAGGGRGDRGRPAPRKRPRHNDGPGADGGESHRGPGAKARPGRAPAASKAKGAGRGRARGPDGRHRVNDAGVEICWAWNHREDGCADVCAQARAHVCEWCRSSQHRSIQCPKRPPGWAPP